MPHSPSIAVVGSINLDLVARCDRLPRPGETLTDATFERVPGGKGANQALAAEYAVAHASELERKVYSVPNEIDAEIARLKLETMGVEIDKLTEEQERYLASWDEGT